MVLHDLNEACRFADHIIGLKMARLSVREDRQM